MSRGNRALIALALVTLALLAVPAPVALSATQPASSAPASSAPASSVPASSAPAVTTPGYPVFSSQLEWPLAALQAGQLWRHGLGAGVSVAVVDTGIDRAQPDLAGSIALTLDFTARHPDDYGEDQSADSHGTAVAGIIAARGSAAGPQHMVGLAPRASLFDIRVAVQPGQVSPDAVAQGIEAAARAGAAIIDVSLIVPAQTPKLSQAVSYALDHHCLIVAAAGTQTAPQALAGYAGVVTVAAVNRAGQAIAPATAGLPAAVSAPATVSAPGADLFSAGETTGPDAAGHGYVHDASGSAFSAGLVAAAVAVLMSADHKLTPVTAARLLVKTAQRTPGAGESGAGESGPAVIDPLAALESALGPAPRPHPSPSPAPAKAAGGSWVTVLAVVGIALLIGVLLAVVLLRVLAVRRRQATRLTLDAIPPSSWDQPW